MAQQVNVSFVDDVDGGEAEGTVFFGLDGKSYEIDLSAENLAKLQEIFAPYVEAGRTGGSARSLRRVTTSSSDRGENQAIREWAQAQGLTVSTRGRISSEVLDAYKARDEVSIVVPSVAVEESKRSRRKSTVAQPTFSGVPA